MSYSHARYTELKCLNSTVKFESYSELLSHVFKGHINYKFYPVPLQELIA